MRLGSGARVRCGSKVGFFCFLLGNEFSFWAYGDALLVVGCTSPALDCGFGRSVELGIAVNYCAGVVELFCAVDAVSVLGAGWSDGWRCIPK